MTNWPAASAVASTTALPASRSSTFAFGAARPAMTASPEGSTFTTSKVGFRGEAAASFEALPPGAEALGGGVAGTAEGTLCVLGSAGTLATIGPPAWFHQRKPGCVQ